MSIMTRRRFWIHMVFFLLLSESCPVTSDLDNSKFPWTIQSQKPHIVNLSNTNLKDLLAKKINLERVVRSEVMDGEVVPSMASVPILHSTRHGHSLLRPTDSPVVLQSIENPASLIRKSELVKLMKGSGRLDITDVFNYKEIMTTNADKLKVGKLCRLKTHLPVPIFSLHSCGACYHYMQNVPGMFASPSHKWKTRIGIWINPIDRSSHEIMVLSDPTPNTTLHIFANSSDSNSHLLNTFANEHAKRNWIDCCEAADRCCERMTQLKVSKTNGTTTFPGGGRTCPATWDGWQCWNETDAGNKAYAPCPHYIYSVLSETTSCSLTAEKICTPEGHWYMKPGSSGGQNEWTNYTNCAGSVIDVQRRRTYVHVASYAVSIVAIIPALLIFFSYKQLRVDRIILHDNLFTSMLVNGIFVIAFKTIIILNELSSDSATATTIISENGIGCRLLFILTKYSRMTNYMWMFCEGYYLHKLIASAFAEQKSLLIFYLIGWVFPIIPTVIYACLRRLYANERCWVVPEESFEWILNGPSLMSLLINMLFLINIIRVLVTKLRAAHANEPSQYRKAVRATLVLLPLFGLHFVVTIYRPPSYATSGTCEWLEIYFVINDVLDGVQGFLVALIFCYLNGEVIFLLRRSYARWMDQHGSRFGCPGRNSAGSTRIRGSQGGSMLRRSLGSATQYSSVPASPDVCCNISRLSLSSSNNQNNLQQDCKQQRPNSAYSPSEKIPLTTVNGNTTTHYQNHQNHKKEVNLAPPSDGGGPCCWSLQGDTNSKCKIPGESSLPTSTETMQSIYEMKPRNSECKLDSLSVPNLNSSTSGVNSEEVKNKHQF